MAGMALFLVLALLAVLAASAASAAVPEECLSCLCQAATGCDANRDCDGSTCGMFALSPQYWKDAGAPGGDFETCALDPACATQSVRAYMQKFSRDCDGDGAVGCDDYCRLHRLGREGCGGRLDAAFASRLASCNASVPLGDFYARSVARPVRQQQQQQGQAWRGGQGGGLPSPGRPVQGAGLSVNPSFSSSVSVSPSYNQGRTSYYQQQGGGGGYRGAAGGYQGGAGGYVSAGGYRGGGYGYEEAGYGGYSGYSGYRRQGGSGYLGGGGGSGGYGGYRGGLWGAGETGGYLSGSSARAGGGVGAARSRPVSASCLACICNALTGCDARAGCANGGCGAFKLSQAYWRDCGSPGGSYEYCTRDYACSSSCVRAYLTKYAQDCNGDGVIDCRDYARIHRLGGFGCFGQLDEPYGSSTQQCLG